jgi:endonuclease YncB( thermonuclease family)
MQPSVGIEPGPARAAIRPRMMALALICLILAAFVPTRSFAREQPLTITGVVVKVRDGDTVQMLTDAGQHIEVRLNGVDAPETTHGSVRGQPYGEQARFSLAQLAARRRATLQQTTMDRYGRHVGLLALHTPQGAIDAGWWQLQSGYAWIYERYLGELPLTMRLRYRQAYSQARAERRGLWIDARPTPPWDWRRRHPLRR